MHAEHGLMYEDARQHQRAAYYYKLAIMAGCQNPGSELDYNVDSVLVGIAEAYDGEWQDTGIYVYDFNCVFYPNSCLWMLSCTNCMMSPCHSRSKESKTIVSKETEFNTCISFQ